MKFENPIMNISMFEVENVLTEASGQAPVGQQTAEQQAIESDLYVNGNTITVTF